LDILKQHVISNLIINAAKPPKDRK